MSSRKIIVCDSCNEKIEEHKDFRIRIHSVNIDAPKHKPNKLDLVDSDFCSFDCFEDWFKSETEVSACP